MFCPACSSSLPPGAYYCPQCGAPIPQPEPEPDQGRAKAQPRLDILVLTLLATLALSLVLSWWLGWPFFIIGGFLPFFWQFRPRRQG